MAVDLETGNEVWRITLPDRIEASAAVSHCGKFIFVGEFGDSFDLDVRFRFFSWSTFIFSFDPDVTYSTGINVLIMTNL